MSHKARTQERRAAPPIYGYKAMTPLGRPFPWAAALVRSGFIFNVSALRNSDLMRFGVKIADNHLFHNIMRGSSA